VKSTELPGEGRAKKSRGRGKSGARSWKSSGGDEAPIMPAEAYIFGIFAGEMRKGKGVPWLASTSDGNIAVLADSGNNDSTFISARSVGIADAPYEYSGVSVFSPREYARSALNATCHATRCSEL
jgi:hypothetical protein